LPEARDAYGIILSQDDRSLSCAIKTAGDWPFNLVV
jgi:hypothetical protein